MLSRNSISSAAALAAATGGKIYVPHSPQSNDDETETAMNLIGNKIKPAGGQDCQPLDFSRGYQKSSTSSKENVNNGGKDGESSDEDLYIKKEYEQEQDQQQQSQQFLHQAQQQSKRKTKQNKYVEQSCFTTPSPSPPERNSGMRNGGNVNNGQQSPQQQQPSAASTVDPSSLLMNPELMQSALMSLMQTAVTGGSSPNAFDPALMQLLKQVQQQQLKQEQVSSPPKSASPQSKQQQQSSAAHGSPNPLINTLAAQLATNGTQVSPITNVSGNNQTANLNAAMAALGNHLPLAALASASSSPFPLDPAVVALTTSKKSSLVTSGIPAVSSPMLAATTPAKFASSGAVSSSTNGNSAAAMAAAAALLSAITPSVTTPVGVVPTNNVSAGLAADVIAHQALASQDQAYQQFRTKVLASKKTTNSSSNSSNGSSTGGGNGHIRKQSNPSMLPSYGESDDNISNCGSNSSFSEADTHLNVSTNSGQQQQLLQQDMMMSPAQYKPQQQQQQQPDSQGRKRARPMPGFLKDEAYWERRRKNNEAAKRSRDLRRAKEDEIAIRCAYLEQENMRLKCQLMETRIELDKVRALWLNSQGMVQGLNGQAQQQASAAANGMLQ